jgi:hypothetical protein
MQAERDLEALETVHQATRPSRQHTPDPCEVSSLWCALADPQ